MKTTIGDLRRLIREAAKKMPWEKDADKRARTALDAAAEDFFRVLNLKPSVDSRSAVARALRNKAIPRPDPKLFSWYALEARGVLNPDPPSEDLSPPPITPKELAAAMARGADAAAAEHEFTTNFGAYKAAAAFLDLAARASIASVALSKGGGPPGEKPSDPLGRYAFAGSNLRVGGRDVPFEPDTPREVDLYADINAHFSQNANLPKKSVNLLAKMLDAGKYSDIFKEPGAKVVYRGVAAGPRWIRALLGLSASDPVPLKGTEKIDYEYKLSDGKAMSWSSSKSIARSFQESSAEEVSHSDKPMYAAVLTATIEDNPGTFLSGPGGLYNLKAAEHYSTESEVLALGPVRVTGITWYGNSAAAEAEPEPTGKKKKRKS